MFHGEFRLAGSLGRTTVGKQMHFQTYSHSGANSTNTGGHCKNPVDRTRNWKHFVQLRRACPPLLSDSQRASFLFTHKCIISIIRVEAVNSPCLQIFKMRWGTGLTKSALADSAFTTEVGLDLQRSMSTSAILWFCKRKLLGGGIVNLELLGQGSDCYHRGHVVISSLHSILTGHCWSLNAFPHPAVYQTVLLHCISPPEHQRISFHDQSHRLKLWPHFNI